METRFLSVITMAIVGMDAAGTGMAECVMGRALARVGTMATTTAQCTGLFFRDTTTMAAVALGVFSRCWRLQ